MGATRQRRRRSSRKTTTSVVSGRDLEEVAQAPDRVWHSNRAGHEDER